MSYEESDQTKVNIPSLELTQLYREYNQLNDRSTVSRLVLRILMAAISVTFLITGQDTQEQSIIFFMISLLLGFVGYVELRYVEIQRTSIQKYIREYRLSVSRGEYDDAWEDSLVRHRWVMRSEYAPYMNLYRTMSLMEPAFWIAISAMTLVYKSL